MRLAPAETRRTVELRLPCISTSGNPRRRSPGQKRANTRSPDKGRGQPEAAVNADAGGGGCEPELPPAGVDPGETSEPGVGKLKFSIKITRKVLQPEPEESGVPEDIGIGAPDAEGAAESCLSSPAAADGANLDQSPERYSSYALGITSSLLSSAVDGGRTWQQWPVPAVQVDEEALPQLSPRSQAQARRALESAQVTPSQT